jgi:Uma2 family endonuclease
MNVRAKHRYTLEEYFELERQSEARLEYWNGEVFNMSGVDPQHDAIEGNVYHSLRNALHGHGCRIFLANLRIKVPAAPPYRYADLSVVCEEPRYEPIGGVNALVNPILIVEVLSDSTEAYDRGDKFTYYQSIPTFREYLLIAQRRPHVTQLVKESDGTWSHHEYIDPDAIVAVVSLGCKLRLRDVYENIQFTENPAPALPPAV